MCLLKKLGTAQLQVKVREQIMKVQRYNTRSASVIKRSVMLL
jgi:hypothetical protein